MSLNVNQQLFDLRRRVDDLERMVRPDAPAPQPKRQELRHDRRTRILEAVADAFGVSPDCMTGRARTEDVCWARKGAALILREQNFSRKEIGIALGGRDHSTAAYLEAQARKLSSSPLRGESFVGFLEEARRLVAA